MEATPVRIVQYFDGEKQSIIPLFQRPYTWTKGNWQTLWDDVISFYDGSAGGSHFMGAIVSIPAKTVPVGVTKHLIIDGQQRLTTSAILLCALRDSLDEKRSAQVQDYLVNRHYENSADYLKLLPTQTDRDSYLNVINSQILDNDNVDLDLITECYFFFKSKLHNQDDYISPEEVFDIVKSNLQVVMINLGESDDPYLIFESLNFKGEPLTQADLVRNYILMRFRGSLESGGEQERIYREIWNPMESRLGEHLENFLRHYITKDGENVKKPRVYAAYKQKFGGSETQLDLETELAKMYKSSIDYCRFIDPSGEKDLNLRKELKLLERLEATIAYPILIKLFSGLENKFLSLETLIKCLKHLNSFILRRLVCDEKRSALNKVFINISSKIPETFEEIDGWLCAELTKKVRSERWPDDDEFKSAIVNNNLYGTKAAKIVLDGIENFLAGKETIDLNNQNITIEHIMPQTLNREWKIILGAGHELVHRKYKDTLGNLTLTGMNSELGNLSFDEKKIIYAKSGISMNREVSQFGKWTVNEITNRANILANYATKIWAKP
jgi:uncharacterized protein with ParB-like and HNH nuclease domain